VGRAAGVSGVLLQLLEEAFPDHKPLYPKQGGPQRGLADQLMRLERRFFSDW
jgi:glutathione S-transferase